jgi:hypothetical protein
MYYQKNLSSTLEAKYFQWQKARYDGLAVCRKRDKGWWNALDFQKTILDFPENLLTGLGYQQILILILKHG